MIIILGSGAGSVNQRYASSDPYPDPDPYQYVTDLQHLLFIEPLQRFRFVCKVHNYLLPWFRLDRTWDPGQTMSSQTVHKTAPPNESNTNIYNICKY
jgi:hypothetical protein